MYTHTYPFIYLPTLLLISSPYLLVLPPPPLPPPPSSSSSSSSTLPLLSATRPHQHHPLLPLPYHYLNIPGSMLCWLYKQEKTLAVSINIPMCGHRPHSFIHGSAFLTGCLLVCLSIYSVFIITYQAQEQ
jgi:hypothetical protein